MNEILSIKLIDSPFPDELPIFTGKVFLPNYIPDNHLFLLNFF